MNKNRLAVLGSPITHSLSPLMQNAALEAMGLPPSYLAMEVKPEELAATLRALSKQGFIGLNITLPHKQRALALVDKVSPHARLLGAINTIVIRNGKLYGHNTDGPGFVAAIKETWNLSIADLRILILGAAGGAGRAIAAQCALEGCRELYLASRTPEALKEQGAFLSQLKPELHVEATNLDHTSLARVMPNIDLIINATSVGMNKNDSSLIPSHLFQSSHFLYDTIYFSEATMLMQSARDAGAQAANGLSMLLHQGALAFELWFDQPAPVDVMRAALVSSQISKKI